MQYLGILDFSKLLMYECCYKYTRTKHDNSAKLFTDTDSLVYEIETNDFYENSSLFDQKIQNFLIQSIKKMKDEVNWSHKRFKSFD